MTGPSEAHDDFLRHPLIEAYVSLRAFGTVVGHLEVVIAELRRRTRPGARILSLGCGAAAKERALARALPDREFTGLDIASEAVALAGAEAGAEGLHNLRVEHGDLNRLSLPAGSFDSVLGLGVIHHVERLEGFWQAIANALRPAGVLLAQEFVGASRLQWNDRQIEAGDRALRDIVPPEHRVHHCSVARLPVEKMLALDPSLAVRSAEILSTCRAAGYHIDGLAGCGCGLLQPVLMYQVGTFEPRNWRHNRILAELFEAEDRLMADGVLGDDFVMFVARPPR